MRVAQHGDERSTDSLRVVGTDQPAELGPYVQHVEVVAGHEHGAREPRRVLAYFHAAEERVVSGDPRERRLLAREIAIHRVAKKPPRLTDAQIATRRTELLARRAEGHELVDVRRFYRLQDLELNQRVDSRRGADTDRKHRDDGDRQRGAQNELTQRVLELTHGRSSERTSTAYATPMPAEEGTATVCLNEEHRDRFLRRFVPKSR